MRIHHIVRTWANPIFVYLKKHFCPICNGQLERVKVSKVVNSKSDEAKEFDFSSPGGDGYMIGNVKFIWTEFRCQKCERNYSIKETKENDFLMERWK